MPSGTSCHCTQKRKRMLNNERRFLQECTHLPPRKRLGEWGNSHRLDQDCWAGIPGNCWPANWCSSWMPFGNIWPKEWMRSCMWWCSTNTCKKRTQEVYNTSTCVVCLLCLCFLHVYTLPHDVQQTATSPRTSPPAYEYTADLVVIPGSWQVSQFVVTRFDIQSNEPPNKQVPASMKNLELPVSNNSSKRTHFAEVFFFQETFANTTG